MHGCGCGPARPLAILPAISQSNSYAFTEDFALGGGEDCQQAKRSVVPASGFLLPNSLAKSCSLLSLVSTFNELSCIFPELIIAEFGE
jgi:hypothetical protein